MFLSGRLLSILLYSETDRSGKEKDNSLSKSIILYFFRDIANQDLNVVFDVEHNYDHDTEDINELLNFRVAMIPKSWTDIYGDTIRVSCPKKILKK